MHCKFLVFLLIVFLFFSFFLRACEFQLIERIGAHGKQNPDFIIFIIIKPRSSMSNVFLKAVSKASTADE